MLVGDHRPVAERVGPFVTPHFLNTVWLYTAGVGQNPVVLSDDRGEVALMEWEGGFGLLGHEDLVDYRSPLGEVEDLLVEYLSSQYKGKEFRFDSLPAEAARVFERALERVGFEYRVQPHTDTAVVDLPETFEQYLTDIGKKQRHEARRKRRRFIGEMGGLGRRTIEEPEAMLDDFFRLHRQAEGSKGSFMTDRMETMFSELLGGEGWRLDALYGEDSPLVAAVIGYSDPDGYYLYNSAYDPDFFHLSPGVVLLNELIEDTIEAGGVVFDFLKGSETYKYRMGARSRALYVVEGRS